MSPAGRKISIQGTVQGVGFRPWVYRLAHEEGVAGTVCNDSSGVVIEAFGPASVLDAFQARLEATAPPAAVVDHLATEPIPGRRLSGFSILTSEERRERRVSIPHDLATCHDCRREVFDPGDRRHRYPFANCTNCGPRFTITLDVPYDRPATTMASFVMCAECQREYDDPGDRRFHAQPNACPECGPRVRLWSADGETLAREGKAVTAAAAEVLDGAIVAVKGLGGFHLLVNGLDSDAVGRLRERKHRYEKPLAIMVRDLEMARQLCEVSEPEARLLASTRAPIVLLARLASSVAPNVAPDNPYLGVMLPYTPLHALLLEELGIPVVATSGNLSDEPICIDESEALDRLRGIADLFLVHDRPIARHADDSVASVVAGEPRLQRRARGWAPAPVDLRAPVPPLLAVGGHLKNSVAVTSGGNVFISQHVGDMETPQACAAFEAVIADLLQMCRVAPVAIACDLHPDYVSTRWAREAATNRSTRLIQVQHHHAHLASCLADNGEVGPALGVIWDGTGYGTDGTVWGGEFLLGAAAGFRRVARLRPFRLPGGDAAVREPRRSAVSLLWEIEGDAALARDELAPLRELGADARELFARMLSTGFRAPVTTSAGRLFDGVAALAGLHQRVSFEGQAAMALEHAADLSTDGAYPFGIERGEPSAPEDDAELLEIDWRPLVSAVTEDARAGVGGGVIAARFHNMLAQAIVAVAERVGESRVVLSGGCFQNRILTERALAALEAAGFEVVLHKRVPANDGGISLGQVAVAAARLAVEG